MFSNNDSIGKTFFVVIALCLVCAIIVSTAAVKLRPQQDANKKLDSQTNILLAAGLLSDRAKAAELFKAHVETKLVDLDTGIVLDKSVAEAENYDYRKAMKDPAQSIVLTSAEDPASVRTRANVAPVYFAYNDGVASGKLSAVVLPVHGYGLWSTMHGFIALDTDFNTIKGINYYEHGETPGLGAEIQNPKWVVQFVGKQLFAADGSPAIKVMKPGNARAGSAHEVDGLSGATLTSNGVQYTFDFWLGTKGFAPFLTQMRKGA